MTLNRYHRQILLPQIGPDGQTALGGARAVIVGCGALGSVLAEQLVRAGVGHLKIIDRDVIEATNLQRQTLFDESDAMLGLPKAVAAANRLRSVNGDVSIEPIVSDLHAGNAEGILGSALILDGTDNAETRYLLNDIAVKNQVPWVYGACVGVEGRVMAIRPGQTPCLRCLYPMPPAAGTLPTCDTTGILGAVAGVVGSMQAVAAIQLLIGVEPPAQLVSMELWKGRLHTTPLDGPRADCPCCGQRRFEFLDRPSRAPAVLCGRNAVQVQPAQQTERVDLGLLAEKLRGVGDVELTPYLLRCQLTGLAELKLTLFADGRMIVHGTSDLERARSIYARYVGI